MNDGTAGASDIVFAILASVATLHPATTKVITLKFSVPKISLRSPITILITLEGLATSPLGCYGCSWNDTPTIDSIAAGGIVWDRWTSPVDRCGGLITQWLNDSHATIRRHSESGGAVFVTDDPKLSIPDSTFGFATSMVLKPTLKRLPAESIHDSAVAQTFAAAIDAVQPKTRLLWIHSGVLRDHWDAPQVDEQVIDENTEPVEDGEIEGLAEKPESIRLPATTDPPAYQVSNDDDPDRLFLWMNRYAAQVRLIDQMIETMLGSVSGRRPAIIIAGASGFSLGENGWVGHHVGPLRSPDIRLPLLVSSGGPLRVPSMESASQLPYFLERLADGGSGRCELVSPNDWCKTQEPFQPLVHTDSDRASHAISTPTWFYVCDSNDPASEKLFLKPDDVTDFNDISRLRREVVQRFSSEFESE
ncbi:MAG: hypothetical protein KDB00_09225 [Planctomycetales bacterium]|nr:hypothetical protein [Planctomycetales bacterium]